VWLGQSLALVSLAWSVTGFLLVLWLVFLWLIVLWCLDPRKSLILVVFG